MHRTSAVLIALAGAAPAFAFQSLQAEPAPQGFADLMQAVERDIRQFRQEGVTSQWHVPQPYGQMRLLLGEGGELQIDTGGREVARVRLADWGRSGAYQQPIGEPASGFSRDESGFPLMGFERPGLDEWYVNSDQGLRQWFRLDSKPVGFGAGLEIRLDVEGAQPLLERNAVRLEGTNIRYAGIHAWDADGKELPADLNVMGEQIVLEVDDSAARYPVTIDPAWTQTDTITGTIGTGFGISIDLSFRWSIVGLPYINSQRGAIWFYERTDGAWMYQQGIGGNTAGDRLGASVAIEGSAAAAGAPNKDLHGTDSGEAYYFRESGGAWSFIDFADKSFNTTPGGEQNGWSVDVTQDAASGRDYVAVGAPTAEGGQGRVRVTEFNTATGAKEGSSAPIARGGIGINFGASLAISNGNLTVQNEGNLLQLSTYSRGAAFTWSFLGGLAVGYGSGNPSAPWDSRVDFKGDVIARSGGSFGYVYNPDFSSGAEVAHASSAGDSTSVAVSDDGTKVAFGYPYSRFGGNPDVGEVRLFDYNSGAGTLTQTHQFRSPDYGVKQFGRSLAMSNEFIFVGEPGDVAAHCFTLLPGVLDVYAPVTRFAYDDGLDIGVDMDGPAPVGGMYVDMSVSSNRGKLSGNTIFVSEGLAVEAEPVQALNNIGDSITTPTTAWGFSVIARSYGTSDSQPVTIIPSMLSSLTFNYNPTQYNKTRSLVIRTTWPAPPDSGGWVIDLTSSLPGTVSVPAQVTIPEGAAQVVVPVTIGPGSTPRFMTVQATLGGRSMSKRLDLVP